MGTNENDSLDDVEKVTQKEHQNIEEDLDIKSETKVTASVIKRGVPKNTKPAPAVVAVKMADLLSAPDDENGLKEDVSSSQTGDLHEPTVNAKEQKQSKEEKLKLEKELKQQEKLRKEEETKAKKEQERLAKLEKQEQKKLEKLKQEEEAKAKKQKEQEEKTKKEEKEEEARAKKEAERLAKQQKQEQEKFEKLQKEKSKKEKVLPERQPNAVQSVLDESIKVGEREPEQQEQANENDKYSLDDVENITQKEHQNIEEEQDIKSESKVTASVIKRGVPKNTKPAPAVVAVKMADLLSVPDNKHDLKE